MKDMIIMKENPQLIEEINNWIVSNSLIIERIKYWKLSFNDKIIDKFVRLYQLDESYKKLFIAIWLIRDILWHSRISANEQKIWYIPKYDSKLDIIKKEFNISWDEPVITISNDVLDLEGKLKAIKYLDDELFPNQSKTIWLNYQRIR